MSIILVGHGSIGSRYKDSLLKKGYKKEEIIIIDKNNSVLEQLKKENFHCLDSLSKLDELNIKKEMGIVANWGPDHIKTALKLVDEGCKKLIIEKPIANSLNELNILKEKCSEKNIFVTVHYLWRYTDLISRVLDLKTKANFFEPVGVRIYGGAVCLSTNGTHFFDLACQILQSSPLTVSADLNIDYINPRDKSLSYIDGNISFKMGNGTFIHSSFSNKNSQSIMANVIFRNGYIEIDTDGNLRCFRRNMEQVLEYKDKVTRYGKMFLISQNRSKEISTVDKVLDNLINDKKPKLDLENAEISLRMVLGAIQSHFQSKRVDLSKISESYIRIS